MYQWPLWSLRGPALCYQLAVQGVAVALVVYTVASTSPPDGTDVVRFAAIAVTGGAVIVGTTLTMQVRKETRRHPWTIHISYLAAGVLILPPNLLVLLLLGPALHGVLGVRPELHRWMFTTTATALAAFVTRWTIGWDRPQWTVASFMLGAAVLLLTRAGLVAVGLRLRAPDARTEEILGDPIDVVLGIVAASLGGLMAVASSSAPAAAVLAAPPIALLELAGQLPQWRRSAQRDAKTGLANAVHWDRTARTELARGENRTLSAALLLLDLDHFKRVNDEIGHLAGDAVLSSVALMLRSSVRREDVVGRFGGEEFVVLLPEADVAVAHEVAQRIRTSVAALTVPTVANDGEPRELDGLTVSIGVATTDRHGYELSELLAAADTALLAAKGNGRNAVTLA